ncbi:hypothetical protein M011DRAFT_320383 [Sporormia fimetaria CBS 119925]|uniref:Uncharacterized protein n=1 Tax=Sporormia fimetaria CBS 119925 TaxID=1340428 RepID=A0A6A6VEF0_9PLEO|nr:hypothetical protein M011DRAFT_320383 [Sporormia fimetaria CBS 119925]
MFRIAKRHAKSRFQSATFTQVLKLKLYKTRRSARVARLSKVGPAASSEPVASQVSRCSNLLQVLKGLAFSGLFPALPIRRQPTGHTSTYLSKSADESVCPLYPDRYGHRVPVNIESLEHKLHIHRSSQEADVVCWPKDVFKGQKIKWSVCTACMVPIVQVRKSSVSCSCTMLQSQ